MVKLVPVTATRRATRRVTATRRAVCSGGVRGCSHAKEGMVKLKFLLLLVVHVKNKYFLFLEGAMLCSPAGLARQLWL